jgi:hypothetical protein
MIKETPGANHPDLPVWQGTRHLSGPAQRDPPSGEQQLLRSALQASGTQVLLRPRINVTHCAGLPSFTDLSDFQLAIAR